MLETCKLLTRHIVSKAFDLDSGEEPICLEQIRIHGENYFALGTMFPEDLDDAGTTNQGYLRLIKMSQHNGSVAQTPMVIARWQAAGCVQDVKAVWDKIAIALDYGVSEFSDLHVAQRLPVRCRSIYWNSTRPNRLIMLCRRLRPGDALPRPPFSVSNGYPAPPIPWMTTTPLPCYVSVFMSAIASRVCMFSSWQAANSSMWPVTICKIGLSLWRS